MLVSIVIPSLHRPDLTELCLCHLIHQTYSHDQFEVIVVENDMEQGRNVPVPSFSGFPFEVRRLLLDSNQGTTGSLNRASIVTASTYLLFLNNDVELEPAFLERLCSELQQNRQISFAAGKLLNASQRNQFDGVGDVILLGGGAYRLGYQDVDNGQFDQGKHLLAGCGAALLIRHSVFDEIHGLDVRFFAYLDDVDLCLRAQLAGYKGRYVPEAVGYHIGSATLGDAVHPKIVRWMTRNQIFLLLKNYPASLLLRLFPRIFVYQVLWCLLCVKRGAFLSYLAGMCGALFSILPILRERRRIMKSKKISDAELLSLLEQSERQVYEWHSQRPKQSQSTLLNAYFRLFGAPATSEALDC